MARKLDKQKPYGTIHGDLEGRHYEQDGVMFTAAGKEWGVPDETEVERIARETADKAAKEAAEKAILDEAVAKRLADLGLAPDGKPLAKAKG
jgi:hypothetical protein